MSKTLYIKKVMVVDDNPIDRMLVEKILHHTNADIEIIECEDGFKALHYLLDDAHTLPDIILLDINMPNLTGFEFLDAFAGLPAMFRDTCKICMLSSSVDPKDIKDAAANPFVSGFFTKPLTMEKWEKISADFFPKQ